MNFIQLDDDSLRKVFSYLSFKDHFNLVFVDERLVNVIYTACKYIHVKQIVKDPKLNSDLDELTLDNVFYKLITGKADDKFKNKYLIFNYIEKLNIEYKIDEPIDLSFMAKLKELNLILTRSNSKCSFINKQYPNIRTLFVREYNLHIQNTFPKILELGCEYIQNDIQTTNTINLLCINTIYADELTKFKNLKMISLELNNNLFNISQLSSLLTKVPSLNKLHINFFLRKNTLSTYTRAIQRLVNLKLQLKLVNLELCIHLTSIKSKESSNTYRESEIKFFKDNSRLFIPNLVTFQLNEITLTYETIPDSVVEFTMVGTEFIDEKSLLPFMVKEDNREQIKSYLKNLKTIKINQGTDNFFNKLSKLTNNKLKAIEIECSVKQELLNSIPIFYKDISSFSLYDQMNCYDISFLKNMRNLRKLNIQINDYKDINDLFVIIKNCIFLNYLTINFNHYELVKDNLINIYHERSNQFPFVNIIITVKFDPIKHSTKTNYNKITDRFSIHILPDLTIS